VRLGLSDEMGVPTFARRIIVPNVVTPTSRKRGVGDGDRYEEEVGEVEARVELLRVKLKSALVLGPSNSTGTGTARELRAKRRANAKEKTMEVPGGQNAMGGGKVVRDDHEQTQLPPHSGNDKNTDSVVNKGERRRR
jgi:hypothetical protein